MSDIHWRYDVHALRRVALNTNESLFRCPKCQQKNSVVGDNHDEFEWALQLWCLTCASTSWVICKMCSSIRTHYTTRKQLNRHRQSAHKAQITTDIITDNNNNIGASIVTTTSLQEVKNGSNNIPSELRSMQTFTYSCLTRNSREYFENNKVSRIGGATHLIAWSYLNSNGRDSDVPNEEVEYHILLALLISKMPRSQVELLGKVMGKGLILQEKQLLAQQNRITTNLLSTTIPSTPERLRSKYVKGKYAVLRNLPCPQIKHMGTHAVVSLRECIADVLAHGVDVDDIDLALDAPNGVVTQLSHCKRACEIAKNARERFLAYPVGDIPIVVLWMNEWSDSFEPSYSIKNNRGSVWVKTITIAPHPTKLHSLTNTYPISIARSSACHEEVQRAFAAELEDLSHSFGELFWSKTHKRHVCVHLELMASLQDQPERRGAHGIMQGLGRFAALWGYSCDINYISQHLPACDNCFNFLMQDTEEKNSHSCSNCLNWDINVLGSLNEFEAPTDYPKSEFLHGQVKLKPKKITYETLKMAVEQCHNCLVKEIWDAATADAFLRVNGLNEKSIDQLLANAFNVITYNTLEKDNKHQRDFEAIKRLRERNPLSFARWQYPCTWDRGTDMANHIDTVMHLVFLGVIKSSLKRFDRWMCVRGKHKSFLRYSSGILETIQQLGLAWCRVLPYPTGGKFVGWVSENFVGLARLLPWFYGNLEQLAGDPIPYVPPEKPQRNWTAVENRKWLESRGLPRPQKEKAADINKRVAHYLSLGEDCPQSLGITGGPVEQVKLVIELLWCMTSQLMCKSVDEHQIAKTERLIKLFLSAFHTMDADLRETLKKKKPHWVTSYNFVCLLNLPNVMREYGPLTNLWEGGGQGEKVLSTIKPFMRGFRMKWQRQALVNVHEQISIKRIVQSFHGSNTDTGTIKQSMHYKCYDSYAMVRQEIRLGRPISAVITKKDDVSESIGIVLMDNGSEVFSSIKMPSQHLKQRCGLFYYEIEFTNFNLGKYDGSTLMKETLTRCCLLLPEMSCTGSNYVGTTASQNRRRYCLIDNEWQSYGPSGFTRPNKVRNDC